MINQEANKKFQECGVLLMLDHPSQLCFGIDNIEWQVGKMFKGLKMIPLGVHIITYSLKEENNMFLISKFINFVPDKRIHIYRWNSQLSLFLQLKGEEAQGYRNGVKKFHFDSFLGVYPESNIQFWKQNTNFINGKVLEKLDPIDHMKVMEEQYSQKNKQQVLNNELVIDAEQQAQGEQQEEIIEDKNAKDQIGKFRDLSDTIYYSQIPRKLKAEKQHISQVNIDKTQILEYVIKKNWSKYEDGIIGEIQYSFISFLIGQNQQSYTQWKKLIDLFCFSQQAFNQKKELMSKFLLIFGSQLLQFPEDFFRDELSKENFMKKCLQRLKLYSVQKSITNSMCKKINKIIQLVENRFSYTINSEEQQQQPVVISMQQNYF